MTKWIDRNRQARQFQYENRIYFSLLRGLMMSADHIASIKGQSIYPLLFHD